MAKNNNLTDFLTDVADAIRAKKGTTAKINPQNFSSEIASIQTGGGSSITPAKPNDVNFYDYDGTILYSYSASQFSSLSSLPSLPSHAGLTCQGWNYTLANAKTYVSSYGKLNIGAMYITDDGSTRLHIRIASEGRMTVPLNFSQTVSNGVSIDWGDGTARQTFSETGNISISHTYANIGDYVIALIVNSGTLGLGNGTSSTATISSTSVNITYANMLQKVEVGNRISFLSNYCFYYCSSLKSITLPKEVTDLGNYTFEYCYSLKNVNIPIGVASMPFYGFSNCYSLESVSIPSEVSSLNSYTFEHCSTLRSIIIPSKVTSTQNYTFGYCSVLQSIIFPSKFNYIGSKSFYSCYVAIYDFTSLTSIPSMSSAESLKVSSDCVIKVPASLLDSWKAATNWSTYASQIVAG